MDAALQRLVRQRAGGRCEYCRLPQAASGVPFEIDHIIFRYEGSILVGCTAIGRTTVEVLRINLPNRVALRELLMEAGLF